MGWWRNPKRFNVAITRAKALLVVIGHPVVLWQVRRFMPPPSCCRHSPLPSSMLRHLSQTEIWSTDPRTNALLVVSVVIVAGCWQTQGCGWWSVKLAASNKLSLPTT